MRERAAGRLGRRTELIELRAKVAELRMAERLLERELAEVRAERDRLLDLLGAERARVDQLLAKMGEEPLASEPGSRKKSLLGCGLF